MAFDPVPFAVGGGAEHSPEVFRTVCYAAMNGNEGVLGYDDLKVTALPTPAAAVNVGPGACGVLARYPGGSYQEYAGRNNATEQVNIAGTGASARTDMIVARVEDPYVSGEPWLDPSNPAVGPYIFNRVISNVPSTATSVKQLNLGFSAIPLARINIPPNSSVITQAMITNLRDLANPRSQRRLYSANPTATNNGPTSSTAVAWPSYAQWNVEVPEWATGMRVAWVLSGILQNRFSTTTDGTTAGYVRISLGGSSGVVTQGAAYDVLVDKAVSNLRVAIGGADTRDTNNSGLAALRGTTAVMRFEGSRTGGNTFLIADTGTSIQLDLEFYEATL